MENISKVFNKDCLIYMQTIPNKFFDLAIFDPPYGLPSKSTHERGKLKYRCLNRGRIQQWDFVPAKEYFDELFRVSKNQIIWGGNYFSLPPCRCVIAWDKCQPWENFSQVEIAWTSFDKPAKLFRYDNRLGRKIHPTQKPIELYTWLLKVFAQEGDTILDTQLGSGSSRIAAYRGGYNFYGCEINKEYFDAQEDRFRSECLGEIKTKDGRIFKQLELFQ